MCDLFEIRDNLDCSVFESDVYLYTQKKGENVVVEYWAKDVLQWRIKLIMDDEFQSLSIWEHEQLCFFSYDGKIEVRQKANGQLLYQKKQGVLSYNNQTFLEFIRDKENRKRGNLNLYHITHNEFSLLTGLSDIERTSFFNIDSQIFSYSNTFIESLTQPLWHISFSELIQSGEASLRSSILHADNKLFFVVDGVNNKGLFSIDIVTGQVLKNIKGPCFEIFQDSSIIYTTLYKDVLCKLNTKTFEVQEWDVADIIKENEVESIHDHRCIAHNDQFYFTQSLGSDRAKLGVLDWKKKELAFKYFFDPTHGGISSIQVTKTKLFVRTQDKSLHIFKIRNTSYA